MPLDKLPKDCPVIPPECGAVPDCLQDLIQCCEEIAVGMVGIDCLLHKQGPELDTNTDPRFGDANGFYATTRNKFNRDVENEETGELGDTITKTFEFTLSEPVIPGSVRILVGRFDCPDLELKDDGKKDEIGDLTGDGTGTVVYASGLVKVTFKSPPAVKEPVLATYRTESPLKTKVWIEQPEWVSLRNVDRGFMEEENHPLRGYFKPSDKVHSGDWIELQTDFVLGGRDFNQLEIVSRDYRDLKIQSLTSYLLAARRQHRD